MNFARLLLASAAIAVLAACSSDSITSPDSSRRSTSTANVEDVADLTSPESELDDTSVNAGECLVITTTVGGVTTTISTCHEMGPYMGGGN